MGLIRQTIALLTAGLAGWLFWQGLDGVLVLLARGSPLSDALLSPPTSLWRLAATFLLLLGALLAAARLPAGASLAAIGTFLYTALGATLALLGSDSSLWMDEVTWSAVLLILSAFLLSLRRG